MTADMNYKPLIKEKIEKFTKEHPEYTVGQIIYSVVAALGGSAIKKGTDFLELSDEDFYTGIDRAIRREKKEKTKDNGK